jgi:hypothetical protein
MHMAGMRQNVCELIPSCNMIVSDVWGLVLMMYCMIKCGLEYNLLEFIMDTTFDFMSLKSKVNISVATVVNVILQCTV